MISHLDVLRLDCDSCGATIGYLDAGDVAAEHHARCPACFHENDLEEPRTDLDEGGSA